MRRPHRLVVHHLVQVVAHHRQAQARGHLGFRSAFRQRGVDGRFHEYRAAFAQINGLFCRKRQRAVIGQRNAQARGLLFDEAAGARRAHLVHLEVGHLPRRQPDVLRVLAADLEHGVHQRIGRRSGASLRGDLVAHSIGPDKVADHGAPAARDARGHHVRRERPTRWASEARPSRTACLGLPRVRRYCASSSTPSVLTSTRFVLVEPTSTPSATGTGWPAASASTAAERGTAPPS